MVKRIEIDEDEIIDMIKSNMSFGEISTHYKTTTPTISKFVKDLRNRRDDIPEVRTGRRAGTFNAPLKPFMRELYNRVMDIEVE